MFMTLLFARRLKGPALEPHGRLSGWFERMLTRSAVALAAQEVAAADRELSPA